MYSVLQTCEGFNKQRPYKMQYKLFSFMISQNVYGETLTPPVHYE